VQQACDWIPELGGHPHHCCGVVRTAILQIGCNGNRADQHESSKQLLCLPSAVDAREALLELATEFQKLAEELEGRYQPDWNRIRSEQVSRMGARR
jgi:hypothetical protein